MSAVEPLVRVYNASPDPRRTRVRWNGVRPRALEATDLAGRPQPGIASQSAGDESATLALRAWQLIALRARQVPGRRFLPR